jgi:hypothetical protein
MSVSLSGGVEPAKALMVPVAGVIGVRTTGPNVAEVQVPEQVIGQVPR